jgi:hypothetical protein
MKLMLAAEATGAAWAAADDERHARSRRQARRRRRPLCHDPAAPGTRPPARHTADGAARGGEDRPGRGHGPAEETRNDAARPAGRGRDAVQEHGNAAGTAVRDRDVRQAVLVEIGHGRRARRRADLAREQAAADRLDSDFAREGQGGDDLVGPVPVEVLDQDGTGTLAEVEAARRIVAERDEEDRASGSVGAPEGP